MTNLFTCTDPLGRQVHLDRSQWESHVIIERSREYLADQVDAVRMTIEDPVTITKSHKNIDREMYYRPFVLRPPHHNFYLKVVVEFPWTSGGASTEGSIITVYVDHEVDPREEVKYGLS